MSHYVSQKGTTTWPGRQTIFSYNALVGTNNSWQVMSKSYRTKLSTCKPYGRRPESTSVPFVMTSYLSALPPPLLAIVCFVILSILPTMFVFSATVEWAIDQVLWTPPEYAFGHPHEARKSAD